MPSKSDIQISMRHSGMLYFSCLQSNLKMKGYVFVVGEPSVTLALPHFSSFKRFCNLPELPHIPILFLFGSGLEIGPRLPVSREGFLTTNLNE